MTENICTIVIKEVKWALDFPPVKMLAANRYVGGKRIVMSDYDFSDIFVL